MKHHEAEGTSKHPKKFKPVSMIERRIRLHVTPTDTGFSIQSDGMTALNKPELQMNVPSGMYLAGACCIMNDTADFLVEHNKDPQSGQKLQLGPWTVVEFTRDKVVTIDGKVLSDYVTLTDGADMEVYQ